jgi:hypothetical protein
MALVGGSCGSELVTGRFGSYDRHPYRDGGTGFVGLDIEAAALLADALAHARQANSHVRSRTQEIGKHLARHAFAIVAYLKDDGRGRGVQRDLRAQTLGMAANVGKRLLEDTEQNEFGRTGQTTCLVGNVGREFDATALGETFDVPTRGGPETGFVEQRRVQQVRNRAGLGYGFV